MAKYRKKHHGGFHLNASVARRRGGGWFDKAKEFARKAKDLAEKHGPAAVAFVRQHLPKAAEIAEKINPRIGNAVGALAKASETAKKLGFGRKKRASMHARKVGALIRRTGMSLGAASRAVKRGRGSPAY